MALIRTSTYPSLHLRSYFITFIIAWTVIIASFIGWIIYDFKTHIYDIAYAEAKSSWETEDLFRQWIADHGGIYVLTTERTPPNPNLSNIADRDTKTPSGKPLTLLNAAYVMRNVHELAKTESGTLYHLASSNPILPQNVADHWEENALQAFAQGEIEMSGVDLIDGVPFMRFMRPLITQQGCLTCHDNDDYSVGGIQGGISVSIPMSLLYSRVSWSFSFIGMMFGFFWIAGLFGIGISMRKIDKHLVEQKRAEEEREQALEALSKSEIWMRNIFNSLDEAVLVVSANRELLNINKAAERTFERLPCNAGNRWAIKYFFENS